MQNIFHKDFDSTILPQKILIKDLKLLFQEVLPT